MRKILGLAVSFVFVVSLFTLAYCEDNILAVDVACPGEKDIPDDKIIQKTEAIDNVIKPEEQVIDTDSSGKELEKMRSYRELIQSKQKELDLIKLDLEKNNLLLKAKETQKSIYQIDKSIPQITNKEYQDSKELSIEPSDIKLQLLLISDNLKEGQVALKGVPYGFKEGDVIASKFTVEKIEACGVTLKEPDGNVLKLTITD